MPGVSILISTHNRRELLARTMESLRELEISADATVELVVVANACNDGTEEMVKGLAGGMPFPTRCVAEPEPGLSRARNRCMAEAKGEIFAFLDDDVWVEKGWLKGLLSGYADGADFTGGRVHLWWEAVQKPAWFTRDYEWILSANESGDARFELKKLGGAIGANFAVHRRVAERVGAFRLDLGRTGKNLAGGEESDYIARAIDAGFKGLYLPDSVVKHWVPPHRATPAYMYAGMAGYTESRILMKPTFGLKVAARAVAGHGYLVAKNFFGAAWARINGDELARVKYGVWMHAGLGGLRGCGRRIFKKR